MGLVLLSLLGLHLYHPRMLYRPRPVPFDEASYFSLYPSLKVDFVSLNSLDGTKLRAYWFPSSQKNKPVLYFLYGSDGHTENAIDYINSARKFEGWNVLLLSYRGYGFSEGSPSMSGIQDDAEAGLNYLLRERGFSPAKILVYGHSFGGAVALHLAVRRPESFSALIIENTFSSVRDMAAISNPGFSWLLFVVTQNWDNKEQVDSLVRMAKNGKTIPRILLVSVGNDQMLSQMRELERRFQAMPPSVLVQKIHLPMAYHYGYQDLDYFKSIGQCAASDKPDCS